MRPLLFLVVLLMTMPLATAAEAISALSSLRRIVVLGDSITQDGNWVTDVTCWWEAQGLDVEVLALGLGSETATPLTAEENAGHQQQYGFPRPCVTERLDRLLAATKPDLVMACYGMNDLSALPPTPAGVARFGEAMTRLRAACLAAGAQRVVLLTPPVREVPESAWATHPHVQGLAAASAWLVAQRAQGWEVLDLHTPMREALLARRRQDPAFGFAKDGVHPGRPGHWVMAQAVLHQWFDAAVEDLPQAEALFAREGATRRQLLRERQQLRFEVWMSQIGHRRPQVVGGPGVPPGPTLAQAQARLAVFEERLRALRATAPPSSR